MLLFRARGHWENTSIKANVRARMLTPPRPPIRGPFRRPPPKEFTEENRVPCGEESSALRSRSAEIKIVERGSARLVQCEFRGPNEGGAPAVSRIRPEIGTARIVQKLAGWEYWGTGGYNCINSASTESAQRGRQAQLKPAYLRTVQ